MLPSIHLPSSPSPTPEPVQDYGCCDWLIDIITAIFNFFFGITVDEFAATPRIENVFDYTRVLYTLHFQPNTYLSFKQNLLAYNDGDKPPYVDLNDQNHTAAFRVSEEDLSHFAEQNGVVPLNEGNFFGVKPNLERPNFYYAAKVRKDYPERYLRIFQRLAPRTSYELEEVVRELNAGHRVEHQIHRLQACYFSHNESSVVLDDIRRHIQDEEVIRKVTTIPPRHASVLFHHHSYLPILEIAALYPELLANYYRQRPHSYLQERDLMKQLCRAIQVEAHGIESDKGGVQNLINIMLEGGLRSDVFTGGLGPPEFSYPDTFSGGHGPYYVLVNPTVYLVPYEIDKQVVGQFLEKAVEMRMISPDEKIDLLRKLHTIPEYIASCAPSANLLE